MTTDMIIKAWKDPLFRATLAAEELASMPSHPVGEIAFREIDTMAINASDGSSSGCGGACCPD
jgi:mersacidin/lichenicidin family type 2 lantibiotic